MRTSPDPVGVVEAYGGFRRPAAFRRTSAPGRWSPPSRPPSEPGTPKVHPDALWATAHGKVLIGFDAIAEFTRAVLPAAEWDGDVTYQVVHIQYLRPDVAAVRVRQVYDSAGGGSEGAPLYVMTKRGDGAWLLHACQNTEAHAGQPGRGARQEAGYGLPVSRRAR